MTKKCIICKTEATPISKARRSFHMFPKNELMRKKWMDSINLTTTPNFKTTYICSDHFDDKSFHDSDELRSRQRLRLDAVPQRISFRKSDDTSKEKDLGSEKLLEGPVDKDYSKSEMVIDPSNTCVKSTNEQDSGSEKLLKGPVDKHYSKSEMVIGPSNTCVKVTNEQDSGSEKLLKGPVDKDYSKSEMAIDPSNTCIKATNEQDCLTGDESNSSMNNVPNSGNKRKHSLVKKIPPKKIRFMNGFKTEYITREDFVSDEAWDRFLRLVTYERNRMAAAHNRNSRKERKIKNFKLLIRNLENSEEVDAAEYVKQDLPPHAQELLTL